MPIHREVGQVARTGAAETADADEHGGGDEYLLAADHVRQGTCAVGGCGVNCKNVRIVGFSVVMIHCSQRPDPQSHAMIASTTKYIVNKGLTCYQLSDDGAH